MTQDPKDETNDDGSSICALCGHIAGAGEAGRFCPADGRALVPKTVYDRYPDDALLGRILLGRYAVVDRVDDFGVGRRYLAIERPGKGDVAVQVVDVPADPDAERIREGFLGRAKLIGRLRHKAYLELVDYWIEPDDNQYFVVTRRVEGQTLRGFLDSTGPLDSAAMVSLFGPVLEAFAEAHEYDFIHGDVRPAVLVFEGSGDARSLRVLDYGLLDTLRPTPPPCASIADEIRVLGQIAYEMLTGIVPVVAGPLPTAESLRMPPVLGVPNAVQAAILRALGFGLAYEDAGEFSRSLHASLLASEIELGTLDLSIPPDLLPPAELLGPTPPLDPSADLRPPTPAPIPPPTKPPAAATPEPNPEPAPASAAIAAPSPEPTRPLVAEPTEQMERTGGGFGWVILALLVAVGALFYWATRSGPPTPDKTIVVNTTPAASVLDGSHDTPKDAATPLTLDASGGDARVLVASDAIAPDATAGAQKKPTNRPARLRKPRRARVVSAPEPIIEKPAIAPKPALPPGDPARIPPIVDRARAAVRRCQPSGAEGRVDVGFMVRPTGRVTNVVLHAQHLAGTRAGQCIKNQILGLGFPAFSGEPMSFRLPFKVGGLERASGGVAMPATLKKAQISQVVRRNMLRIRQCRTEDERAGKVSIKAVIGRNGAVSSASVLKSTMERPATARCVRATVSKLRFPQFSGKPISLTLPFQL